MAKQLLRMNVKRLYQPRNPLFWIMVALNLSSCFAKGRHYVALNLLSAALGWLTHTHEMGVFFGLIIALFALGNAVLGAYLMWRLVNT